MADRLMGETELPKRAGPEALDAKVRMDVDRDSEVLGTYGDLQSSPPFTKVESIGTELCEGRALVPRAEAKPVLSWNTAKQATDIQLGRPRPVGQAVVKAVAVTRHAVYGTRV